MFSHVALSTKTQDGTDVFHLLCGFSKTESPGAKFCSLSMRSWQGRSHAERKRRWLCSRCEQLGGGTLRRRRISTHCTRRNTESTQRVTFILSCRSMVTQLCVEKGSGRTIRTHSLDQKNDETTLPSANSNSNARPSSTRSNGKREYPVHLIPSANGIRNFNLLSETLLFDRSNEERERKRETRNPKGTKPRLDSDYPQPGGPR